MPDEMNSHRDGSTFDKLIELAGRDAAEWQNAALDAAAGSSTASSDSIPGYEIIREIHRGGQGVVYQALQRSTKRKVAVKVMREGPFASKRDKARFEREIEILGQLSHPNIVAIHDSGLASGSFYFVMDYISGQPLDVWIASGQHSIEETLRLFARICDAVNAAHLRGIIHRDLKPGNIRIDGQGEPHVLDFGLAKVASATELSVMTMTGQFLGSLPWASPEQAEGMPDRIDTRTDVYSLGVILYQMLTSKFPYDVVGSMREVLDRIIRQDPVKPSSLRRQINDEVETIVLKCLAKERERRYQTAGELARDIRHYLAGEPVEAKRDSALYVLKKHLVLYKLPMVVAGGFLVMIAASLTIALALWRQAAYQRNVADLARDVAEQKTRDTGRALMKAQEEEARSTQAAYYASLAVARMYLQQMRLVEAAEWLASAPEKHRQWEWGYLQRLAHRESRTLSGHEGEIWSVACSPSGGQIVSASKDGTARIWDVRTGQVVSILGGHAAPVFAAAFSPDGRVVATGGRDQTVRIWDSGTGRELKVLKGHGDRVMCVSFSPDGALLASGCGNYQNSREHSVRIWDLQTGQQQMQLGGHDPCVYAVAFSPDGKTLATGGGDGRTAVWELTNGQEVASFKHDTMVMAVCFSPDGRRLITGSADHTVRIWDVVAKTEAASLAHPSSVRSMAVSPDGERVASGCEDRVTRVWDVRTGRELFKLQGHSHRVNSVTFLAGQSQLVTGSADQTIRIWSLDRVPDRTALRGHTAPVAAIAFSPDGRLLASVGADRAVRLWDVGVRQELHSFEVASTQGGSVAFSPDGQHLAAGVGETVFCWDVFSRKEIVRLEEAACFPGSVCFAPDGQRLVVTCVRGKAQVWDLGSRQKMLVLSPDTCDAAVSPNGRYIATAGGYPNVGLWDTQNGREVAQLTGHGRSTDCAAFSPDGTRVAMGSWDHTARIWSVPAGKELIRCIGHTHGVISLAWSPNGQRLVTGSVDGTAKVWHTDTGIELLNLQGHAGPVCSVAFSPDGQIIATASSGDEAILLWTSAPLEQESETRPASTSHGTR